MSGTEVASPVLCDRNYQKEKEKADQKEKQIRIFLTCFSFGGASSLVNALVKNSVCVETKIKNKIKINKKKIGNNQDGVKRKIRTCTKLQFRSECHFLVLIIILGVPTSQAEKGHDTVWHHSKARKRLAHDAKFKIKLQKLR